MLSPTTTTKGERRSYLARGASSARTSNRLERRIGVLDLEIWGLQRLRTLELRADLKRSGFDVTGLEPLPCPTDAERQASRHRSRPDIDALTTHEQKRQQTAADSSEHS